MKKDFHIIIVTYNRINFLKNCINCILKQKNVSIFLEIIDNGSTDNTKIYLQEFNKYEDKNIVIKVHRKEKNIDPLLASTSTVKKFKGDFINFLGDDDWYNSDQVLYRVKTLFSTDSFATVMTSFKKINLNDDSKAYEFSKFNQTSLEINNDKLEKMNSYEIIYSQALQWRFSLKNKKLNHYLKRDEGYYRNISYHSSATFINSEHIFKEKLNVKDLLSRPFGDIGFLKIQSKNKVNLMYKEDCLSIGVPIVRETMLIKKPQNNPRINSYLELSLKEKGSLNIPLFSIICTNQFLREINLLDTEIKLKRGLKFRIYRTKDIIFSFYRLNEKIKFLYNLWLKRKH